MIFRDFLANNRPEFIDLREYKTEDGKLKDLTEDDFKDLLDFVKVNFSYHVEIMDKNQKNQWAKSKFKDAIEAQFRKNVERFERLEKEEQYKIHREHEEKWPTEIEEPKEPIEDFLQCESCTKIYGEQKEPIISKCFKHLFCHTNCQPNIKLKKYTKDLTENDFKTILEFIKEQYYSDYVSFNSKQLRQFIKSSFRDEICRELNEHSAIRRRAYNCTEGYEKNELGNRVIFTRTVGKCLIGIEPHQPENYGRSYYEEDEFGNRCKVKLNDKPRINRPRIYVPRKGMVWEKMIGYEIGDPDFLELKELREETKRPKVFIFDFNKNPSRKKVLENKAKLFLDNDCSKILTLDLIEDYYSLKKSKRMNFKE